MTQETSVDTGSRKSGAVAHPHRREKLNLARLQFQADRPQFTYDATPAIRSFREIDDKDTVKYVR
jgi:hypothetical protein